MDGEMGQVITASRLRDGVVLFMGGDFAWVEEIGAARIFATAETTAAGLAACKKDEEDNLVLDIYAIDVAEKDGAIVPTRLREAIRAVGPTVHPEHGKRPLGSMRQG